MSSGQILAYVIASLDRFNILFDSSNDFLRPLTPRKRVETEANASVSAGAGAATRAATPRRVAGCSFDPSIKRFAAF
eukprot:7933389-Pyramimonas_sp.AAC.1